MAYFQKQPLSVTPAGLIGQRLAVLGMSGSGKSHTIKFLLETLAGGEQAIPMSILDLEGEYWPLQALGFVVAGEPGDPHVTVPCRVDHAATLARFSVQQGVSVVVSLAHLNRQAVKEFVEAYLAALWDAQRAQKSPYFLIVEEAQEFVPQSRTSPVADLLTTIFKRGRKYGLGAILASQRSTAVDKDVLTQAGILILHRVLHPADLKIYYDLIPLDRKDAAEQVRKLHIGQAVIVKEGQYLGAAQISAPQLFSGDAAPGSTPTALPAVRAVDETVLAELRALLAAPTHPEDPEKEGLRRRIADLELANAELQHRVEELTAENEHWQTAASRIKRIDVEAIHAERIVGLDSAEPGKDRQEVHAETAPEVRAAGSPVEARLLAEAEQRRAGMEAAVLKREQREFDRLLHSIQQTGGAWRSVYAYLLDREGQSFTIRQLARLLAYNSATLYKHPPMLLLEEKLLVRKGRGEGIEYRSRTLDLLRERFPNSDPAELWSRILKLVAPR